MQGLVQNNACTLLWNLAVASSDYDPQVEHQTVMLEVSNGVSGVVGSPFPSPAGSKD